MATSAFSYPNAASVLTTKGDLLGYSTVPARAPVGADGTVLTADSTNANGVSYQAGVSSLLFGLFGDGSDGAATFDGTATPAGTSKVGSVYTMTRDVYYTTAHLSNTTSVLPGAFRFFCQGVLTVDSGCSINRNGLAGGNLTAGNALGAGTVGGSGSGGAGGNQAAGSTASNTTTALGGAGGAGGAATGSGTGGGPVGGAATPPVATQGTPHNLLQTINPYVINNFTLFTGGAGGGGGSAPTGSTAGGGGGAAAIVALYAYAIVLNGTITAIGGAGGTGTIGTGTGSGGGGGGGGGVLIILYHSLTGTNATITAAVNCAGGAGGGRTGTGNIGAAGSTGQLFLTPV